MTNTGDFRRYTYSNNDTDYALKAFDAHRSSAAPKYTPDYEKKSYGLKVHKPVTKTKEQLKKEQKASFRMATRVVVCFCVMFAVVSGLIYTYVQKNELTHQVASVSEQLDISKSENTKLNSQLNSLASMSQIDKYAVENLGMVKLQSNQVKYIDVAQYKQQRQNISKQKSPAASAKQLK